MNWSGMMLKYGWKQEVVGNEPFSPLAQQVKAAKDAGLPTARIGTTVGTSRDYGEVKVSFTVTIECPQDEGSMNLAAESAYTKACELVNDAASFVGLPVLPVPE